jgi:voltage-gated potassium channel
MTGTAAVLPLADRPGWKYVAGVVLRMTLSVVALFAAYFLLPTRRQEEASDVPWIIVQLFLFAAIVGIQIPLIVKARYPVLRAIESLAILLPIYLLIFSRIYLSFSLADPSAFTQPLTHVSALYFTVTVFASVGFGDIVAQTDSLRIMVTIQMLLNLAVFGLVIRVVVGAARRGVARRDTQPTATLEDPQDV